MGAINNAFNRAGWSILQLASATAEYRAKRNEEGKNKAKQSYDKFATIKKQNDELTKNQKEAPKSYFGPGWNIPPEIDEQKIAEQTVLKETTKEKAKVTSFGELAGVEEAPAPKQVTSFGELPTVSAENSETNISAKDPEVQGLINVKQKNALRAVAGQRSQNRYQKIKAELTGRFADYSNIDDVWREISLAPDITDEMIRKAGLTKTKILEEWKLFKDYPSEWAAMQNNRGDNYGAGGLNESDSEYLSDYDFGGTLSTYIRAKAGGKTLKQQQEEYDLSKAEEDDELYESIGEAVEKHELKQAKNKQPSVDDWYLNFDRNYKVWQDEPTEEEKDEEKKDRESKGIIF